MDTNVSRTLKSNEVGRYEFVALQPGPYEIRAAKSGFASLVRTGITLSVGARAVVDLAMTVSAGVQTVTVNADVAAVDPDKTEVSTVVNMNDMLNLPLNGRRWDAFVMNTPGASNDGAYGLITFRGISGLYNNNMVDGMDNTRPSSRRPRAARACSTASAQKRSRSSRSARAISQRSMAARRVA